MKPAASMVATPPSDEPVSLAEAKQHCRVDHDVEDAHIQRLIVAARGHIEGHAGAIMSQSLDVWWSGFPAGGCCLELPWGRTASIAQFGHTASAGGEVAWTISGSDLQLSSVTIAHLDAKRRPGRIVLAHNQSWPSAELKTANPVRARIVAGWATAADVPSEIKAAILLLVDHWRRHRSEAEPEMSRPIQAGVATLIRKFRRVI